MFYFFEDSVSILWSTSCAAFFIFSFIHLFLLVSDQILKSRQVLLVNLVRPDECLGSLEWVRVQASNNGSFLVSNIYIDLESTIIHRLIVRDILKCSIFLWGSWFFTNIGLESILSFFPLELIFILRHISLHVLMLVDTLSMKICPFITVLPFKVLIFLAVLRASNTWLEWHLLI